MAAEKAQPSSRLTEQNELAPRRSFNLTRVMCSTPKFIIRRSEIHFVPKRAMSGVVGMP